ncbi:MAG TPA: GtrA family protein [Rudaea sp.]|jgi:putative flippase GtrA|nr:GtrA family protein [Rudaea sp.]
MKSHLRRLAIFSLVGVVGFIVDAGILQLLVLGLAWDRYSGRLISFLFAATATWLLNRRYTFRGPRKHSLGVEWARYILAMSGGFACNFAAYSALVYFFDVDRQWLILAVAAGSVAGLGVNYTASHYWVYRHHRRPVAGTGDGPGN